MDRHINCGIFIKLTTTQQRKWINYYLQQHGWISHTHQVGDYLWKSLVRVWGGHLGSCSNSCLGGGSMGIPLVIITEYFSFYSLFCTYVVFYSNIYKNSPWGLIMKTQCPSSPSCCLKAAPGNQFWLFSLHL